MYEVLHSDMQRELSRWATSTMIYAAIYVVLRAFVIIVSAVVAGKAQLTGTPASGVAAWVPVLAISVTIAAGLDAWIQPQRKWQGFMADRDHLSSLIRLVEANKTDQAQLKAISDQFDALREQHRKSNVF